MLDFVLNITSPDGIKEVPLNTSRLTIGRTDLATIVINDEGLSRLHASIHRDGNQIWILDEGSTNGTYVNGAMVSPSGTPLSKGDRIQLGNQTTIIINTATPNVVNQPGIVAGTVPVAPHPTVPVNNHLSQLPLIASVAAIALLAICIIGFGAYKLKSRDKASNKRNINISSINSNEDLLVSTTNSNELDLNGSLTTPQPSPDLIPTPTIDPLASLPPPSSSPVNVPSGPVKLYLKMTPEEQVEFVEKRAQHISMMMGNRPYQFTPEVVKIIKGYVDGYARRVGNNSTRLWGEDMRFMFARARTQYVPHIIRAFNAKGVPPVVGLYLCVIETEYHNIQSENFAGAAGLFQFIGPTAEAYGVPRAERTNVEKMAPAAAAYIADRIAEFGTDSMSVALGIAGYNRNPDSVRRDLHDVLNSENKERSFWTLVANSSQLDRWFQGENIKYVPKFFAAAIVGENPWNFGLDMRPLSTYTEVEQQTTAREVNR
jgi:hypothetical protein